MAKRKRNSLLVMLAVLPALTAVKADMLLFHNFEDQKASQTAQNREVRNRFLCKLIDNVGVDQIRAITVAPDSWDSDFVDACQQMCINTIFITGNAHPPVADAVAKAHAQGWKAYAMQYPLLYFNMENYGYPDRYQYLFHESKNSSIENRCFETVDSDWTFYRWRGLLSNPYATGQWDDMDSFDGTYSVTVRHEDPENFESQYGGFRQEIPVEPDRIYILTAYIKTSEIHGQGVGIQFGEVYDATAGIGSTPLTETNDWTRVQATYRTKPDQTSVWISLGQYRSTGIAWFDQITLRGLPYHQAGLSWHCPSWPQVRDVSINQITLPRLLACGADGTIFDYIRSPGDNHCYCDKCSELVETTGKSRSEVKKESLAAYMSEFRAALDAQNPSLRIAVCARRPSIRQRNAQMYDEWVKNGYCDLAAIMIYTRHLDTFQDVVDAVVDLGIQNATIASPGIRHIVNPSNVHDQMELIRSRGLAGAWIYRYEDTAMYEPTYSPSDWWDAYAEVLCTP